MIRFALPLLFAAASVQAAITGTLVDEHAKPVAGATIRAYAAEDWKSTARRLIAGAADRPIVATAQTAEDGSFKIDPKTPLVDLAIEANGLRTRTIESPADDELNVIVLRAAKAKKVRLVSGNKPVANAIVAAGPLIARSDNDGNVDFPESASRVFIVHPDFAPMSDFSGGDLQHNEVPLSRGVAVRGKVVDADGKPVANASVTVGGWPLAESGADGTFAIAHPPSNWKMLRASDATRVGVANNTRAGSYEVKLQPAATITGTAMPGTRIYFDTGTPDSDGLESVIADAQGKFSAMLPARMYTLRGARAGYQIAKADVVVQKGQTVTRALPAKPLAIVRGRVVDEEKQPVEGAFVWTAIAGGVGNRLLVRTGADGGFAVRYNDSPSPNLKMQVFATKKGYAAGAAAIPTGAAAVTVTLPKGFPLEARVVDRQGKRVANANVFFNAGSEDAISAAGIVAACEEPLSSTCRTTDDSGTVHFRVTPGPYNAFIAGDSIVSRRQVKQTITPESSPVTLEVDRGVEISGRVAYSDRTPAADVMVISRSFGGGAARTDSDGFFVLRNVMPGKMTLYASDDARIESTPVDVEAPARGVALTIPTPARLEGRIVDKDTSAPVTDFQLAIVVHQAGGGSSMGNRLTFHSDDGSYVVDRISPRTLDIQVTAAGYAAGSLSGVAAEEGRTLRVADIQLDKGGSIRGRVTANNQPVSGVSVRVGGGRPFMLPGTSDHVTDENGEFFLDGVSTGDQTVNFDRQGYVPRRKNVEVVKGKEARLDIELDRGQQLQGRVVDKNGAPIAGARLSARGISVIGQRPATSDASGNFTIEALSEGKYTIQAVKQGYVDGVANDVTIPATAPVNLTLDTGGTLTGRVIGLTPAELAAVEVIAAGRGSAARASVNNDGTFTLRGVPEGRVSVSAYVRGGPRVRQSVSQNVDVVNGAGPAVQIDFNEGLTITGRVTQSGSPVAAGSVSFSSVKANRQSPITGDGSYQVDGLPAGDYDVTVYSQTGTLFRSKYTATSNASFDIQIAGATVRGRVVDASTGAPVSDIVVITMGTRANSTPRRATTDSGGAFTLEAVPDGSLEVRASPTKKYAMQSQTVTVTNGSAPDLLFRLESVQPTTFRVTDAATGAPVDPIISVMNGNRSPIAGSSNPRDDDGGVRVYVPAGSYTARVWARGYLPESVSFTAPGSDVPVRLNAAGKLIVVASRPTRIRLVSATANSAPITGVGGPMALPEGLPMDNLRPGAYRIDVVGDDGKSVIRSVPATVISGQTTTVRVD